MSKNRIVTGDRPTGRLHIGHYFGSLKHRVKMQNSGEYDQYENYLSVQTDFQKIYMCDLEALP